jgi:hypothetical protein
MLIISIGLIELWSGTGRGAGEEPATEYGPDEKASR